MKIYIYSWHGGLDNLNIPAKLVEVAQPNSSAIYKISSLKKFITDWNRFVMIAANTRDEGVSYDIYVSKDGRFCQRG